MKNIFKLTLCSILFVSCSYIDNNLMEDLLDRGGFIQFEKDPELYFDILEFNDLEFSAEIVDHNKNAVSYALNVEYEGKKVENFIEINSFPSTLTITGQMIMDALGITAKDVNVNSEFIFTAAVTTDTGLVYTAEPPSFNTSTNEPEGGITADVMLRPGLRDAMIFNFKFFMGEVQKLRGTSFEEPWGSADPSVRYRRSNATEEGELPNNPGQPTVKWVAVGNGVDDEIGFKTEFIDDGRSGFTSEQIGVTRKASGGNYPAYYVDGEQGYITEDIDGIIRLTFDRVVVPAEHSKSGVQVYVFPANTSWESDDYIHISAIVERGNNVETLVLLDVTGDDNSSRSDIDKIEKQWNLVTSGFLEGVTAYTLIIDTSSSAGSEQIYYDDMKVFIPK